MPCYIYLLPLSGMNKLASNLKLSIGPMHAYYNTRTLHTSLHKHSEIARMNTVIAVHVEKATCIRTSCPSLEIHTNARAMLDILLVHVCCVRAYTFKI